MTTSMNTHRKCVNEKEKHFIEITQLSPVMLWSKDPVPMVLCEYG